MHPWFDDWYPRICQWLIPGWYLAGESSQLRGFGMFILWIWWFRSTSKPSSNTKPGGQASVGCRVHQVLTECTARPRHLFAYVCLFKVELTHIFYIHKIPGDFEIQKGSSLVINGKGQRKFAMEYVPAKLVAFPTMFEFMCGNLSGNSPRNMEKKDFFSCRFPL